MGLLGVPQGFFFSVLILPSYRAESTVILSLVLLF